MLDQPFDLLLNHLLRWQEEVLQHLYQLGLQLWAGHPLPGLHDLHNRLLRAQNAQLDNRLVILLSALFGGQLQPADQVQLAPLLWFSIFAMGCECGEK